MNSGDLFTELILKPHSKVTVRTDYHWLQLSSSRDLWYSGGGATNETFFGYQGLNSGGNHNLADFTDVRDMVRAQAALLDHLGILRQEIDKARSRLTLVPKCFPGMV